MQKRCHFPLFILILGTQGCVNNFEQFYQPSENLSENLKVTRLKPYTGQVAIYSSNDLPEDAKRMMLSGNLYLGESNFSTTRAPTKGQLIDEAKAVKADLVLVNTE